MVGLLIAGTLVFCAGVLTVVFGIPIKEFSFGNTIILAGVVVACTGLLMMGLSIVVRELKNLSRRLEASGSVTVPREPIPVALPPRGSMAPDLPKVVRPTPSRPASSGFLFPRDQPHDFETAADADRSASHSPSDHPSDHPSDAEIASASSQSPPWKDDLSGRSRATPPLFPNPAEPVAESSTERAARRNFLFSSRRRDAAAATTPPDASVADEHPQHDAVPDAPEPTEAPDRFTTAWPQSERTRSDTDAARSSAASANGGSRFPSPRRPEAPSVTIVKSGVVDAMAYSLYSDGSIEAQMPEGMVRFESIDELRAHLDQRA